MLNNLAKLVIENGGSIQPLIIPSEFTNGTGITNPSILIDGDKILVNLRHVQYTLYHSEGNQLFQNQWGPLAYLNPEDDITLTTTNYLCELEPNTLNIEKYVKVDTTAFDKKPLWEFVGLEDVRLVKWNRCLYLCGVRRDTTTNGEGRMEMSEIVDGKEVARNRIQPPTASYCEKNWMPILDKPYCFVKWSNPTEVVQVNVENKSATTTHLNTDAIEVPRDIRGGSQVISYKDYYIALTHEVDLWHNEQGKKDAQYYHRFIVWNKDWSIAARSSEFKFLDCSIEFSCGMALQGNDLLITFGTQDSTAFIVRFPTQLFEHLVGLVKEIQPKPKALSTPQMLENYINNPRNENYCYNLAEYFWEKGHTASALSFYLKAAEYGLDSNVVYTSLIQIGKCLSKQGRRQCSEKTSYYNAISYNPTRPEAYLSLSQFYECKKEWVESYAMACCALERANKQDVLYYTYLFQVAVTSWWVGRGKQSRELFFDLANNYVPLMSEQYRKLVQTNITSLGSGPNPFQPYTALQYNNLRYKFPGASDIKGNYSQTYQDMFILTMLNGKCNGKYIEIGAADPFYGSNTALLEKQFGWKGVSLEILQHEVDKFKANRSNPIILADATKIDYDNFIQNLNMGSEFDYLQVDCEPPSTTFEILKKIPFEKYKFAVITFEHDYYADVTKSYRDLSREFLVSKGYELVVSNISPNDYCPYEDWWIHPDLVDINLVATMKNVDDSIKSAERYMLGTL